MTERKHAPMSASRMSRIMTCPGSFKLENSMPYEPAGEAAERGTRIHEMAEHLLKNIEMGFAHDAEELAVAHDYVEYLKAISENARKTYYEMDVDAGLQEINSNFGGTADAVIIDGDTLHVVDLKTGRIKVDAKENIQLMTYALGVVMKLKAPVEAKVFLHIFQPGNISVWETSVEDLYTHGLKMQEAADLALSQDPPYTSSVDACKYCRGKPVCPELRRQVQETARIDFAEPVLQSIENKITPEMLDAAEQAIAWGESIQASAKKQLKALIAIPGWDLKPGRKMKSWTDEKRASEILRDRPEAWSLKSPSAVSKLGVDLTDLVTEKISEPSLTRV